MMQAQAPFQGFPPELLAQIAQAAFRPPQGMGMQAPQVQQTPGFNVGGDAYAGLGKGLGMGLDALFGYRGDPAASAAYGSQRPAIPADVMAGRGWLGGGT